MTQDEIEQSVAGYRAWLEGKQVQTICDDAWVKLHPDDTIERTWILRPTPQPKLRPWRPEEVPLLAEVRRKTPSLKANRAIITAVKDDKLVSQLGSTPLGDACESWEHSTDNGKTWRHCGVEEVGQ